MQINRWQSLLFTLLALCTSLRLCAANELPATVSNALKHAAIPTKAIGIVVQEVGSHQALIAVNPAGAFNPASTMKLVTTDASLELLGPTFTWKTQAYITGSVNGDELNGNLIFKGSGDPKLVTENFWLFLRQIRATGIREIHGNIVLDRSAFEPIQTDSEKFDGDPIKPYNAVPDALLLNYQALRFQFIPANVGGLPSIIVDPQLANFDIAAPAWTKEDCGDWQSKLGMNLTASGVRFAGRYAASCGDRTWYVRPYQLTANQYFSTVFKKMWSDVGGKIRGDVVDGLTPPDARLLTVWESPALSEVVRDINKFSNNIMARQLLLTLANAPTAAGVASTPANEQRGAQAIREWLVDKHIDASELFIENGSGLSRNERIAPATMADLLLKAYQSPLMPEFIASMPLVGYDGTMRHRLADQDVAGNAHIKTGTLNEVKAVAGYVTALSGKRYVIVFFINHPNAGGGGAAQDALLEWIYSHG
jgi:D-alanyl-D-alanine carboxypeptidase/D-alanyl-D-alanine-endopeptidase (penicillin-binding protein 4)